MPSPAEFLVHHYLILLVALGLVVTAVSSIQQRVRAAKAANWPATEGIIQIVRRVAVPDAGGPIVTYRMVPVGDFSYKVNDEYYSGVLGISRSFSTGDALPGELINQKIQVRYNPRKPEQYSVFPQEIGGFLLDPFNEPTAKDGPVDLNLDKI
jgi:hypothetical protein